MESFGKTALFFYINWVPNWHFWNHINCTHYIQHTIIYLAQGNSMMNQQIIRETTSKIMECNYQSNRWMNTPIVSIHNIIITIIVTHLMKMKFNFVVQIPKGRIILTTCPFPYCWTNKVVHLFHWSCIPYSDFAASCFTGFLMLTKCIIQRQNISLLGKHTIACFRAIIFKHKIQNFNVIISSFRCLIWILHPRKCTK